MCVVCWCLLCVARGGLFVGWRVVLWRVAWFVCGCGFVRVYVRGCVAVMCVCGCVCGGGWCVCLCGRELVWLYVYVVGWLCVGCAVGRVFGCVCVVVGVFVLVGSACDKVFVRVCLRVCPVGWLCV